MIKYGVTGGLIGPMTAYQWLMTIKDIRITDKGREKYWDSILSQDEYK
jgi:hypothetical protein